MDMISLELRIGGSLLLSFHCILFFIHWSEVLLLYDRNESYACSLEWVGRAEEISRGGLATIIDTGEFCTSLITHVVDFYMREMEYDGFINDAFTHYLDSISTYQCPEDDGSYFDIDETYKLTMKDMGGIFLWHFVAVMFALILAICKYYHRKRKNNTNTEN